MGHRGDAPNGYGFDAMISDPGNDPTGPNPETLKALAGMMPSFAQGVVEGKLKGKGVKVGPPPQYPTKICVICATTFDFITGGGERVLLKGHCPRCQKFLDEGNTAFVHGDEFMFAKSESLKDMAGKVVRVKPETFAALKKQYEQEWKTDETQPG